MYTFGQLCIGDLFNTKSARWVKTRSEYAVCVMSSIHAIGEEFKFIDDTFVVLLWSSLLSDDPACSERKSEQPSLSESEKEDRFYREIEDNLDAVNRELEAAEFRQSLIDERDALKARRACLNHYSESGKVGDRESYWLSEQYNVMFQYIVALDARLDLLHKSAKTKRIGHMLTPN